MSADHEAFVDRRRTPGFAPTAVDFEPLSGPDCRGEGWEKTALLTVDAIFIEVAEVEPARAGVDVIGGIPTRIVGPYQRFRLRPGQGSDCCARLRPPWTCHRVEI